jgi:hypothetical protein
MGGSFISTGQLASKYARYQFRPHFFQHASFRVVMPEVGGWSKGGAVAGNAAGSSRRFSEDQVCCIDTVL